MNASLEKNIMSYQDQNSPFFQGSAGPTDSLGGDSGVGRSRNSVNMSGQELGGGAFPASGEMGEGMTPIQPVPEAMQQPQQQEVQPESQAPVQQPVVQQQAQSPVTLGEVRDNLTSVDASNEGEPPTLESTETGINDMFNQAYGTSGSLELDPEDVPVAPAAQDEVLNQVNRQAAAKSNEPIQNTQVTFSPALAEEPQTDAVSNSAPSPQTVSDPAPVLTEVQEPVMESEQIEMDSVEKGSVEDRMSRLKRMSKRSNASEPPVGPPIAGEPPAQGQSANPDIPDL